MPHFDDKREELSQNLFGKNSKNAQPDKAIPQPLGLKAQFIKLERLKKQELSRWWDGVTLQQYIENKKVPRGLRILIFPTFEDLSSDLLCEWEANLEGASVTMMQILIRHAREKGAKLALEIEALEKEIEQGDNKDAIEKNFEILKRVRETHQLYLKDKKLRKIKRDDKDYNEGRIYTFAKRLDSLLSNESKKRVREASEETRTASSTSLSSVGSSTTDSIPENIPLDEGLSTFQREMARLRVSGNQAKRGQQEKRQGGAAVERREEVANPSEDPIRRSERTKKQREQGK